MEEDKKDSLRAIRDEDGQPLHPAVRGEETKKSVLGNKLLRADPTTEAQPLLIHEIFTQYPNEPTNKH